MKLAKSINLFNHMVYLYILIGVKPLLSLVFFFVTFCIGSCFFKSFIESLKLKI